MTTSSHPRKRPADYISYLYDRVNKYESKTYKNTPWKVLKVDIPEYQKAYSVGWWNFFRGLMP